jgi:hypothetical protein
MTAATSFPAIEEHLPDLTTFVRDLAGRIQAGEIDSWEPFAREVRAFFVPGEMARVEQAAPGWGAMASQAKGVTLVHVTAAFVALLLCPEFQAASLHEQALMKWVIVFHDLAKQVRPGQRDPLHAYRSAVLAAAALPGLGFAKPPAYEESFPRWKDLTWTAVLRCEDGTVRQDNGRLPEILAGLDGLFGPGTPAALIVRTILLHMTVTALADWPAWSELDDADVRRYFDLESLSLLRLMMLADSDAWCLFDPPVRERYHHEILGVFSALEAVLRG